MIQLPIYLVIGVAFVPLATAMPSDPREATVNASMEQLVADTCSAKPCRSTCEFQVKECLSLQEMVNATGIAKPTVEDYCRNSGTELLNCILNVYACRGLLPSSGFEGVPLIRELTDMPPTRGSNTPCSKGPEDKTWETELMCRVRNIDGCFQKVTKCKTFFSSSDKKILLPLEEAKCSKYFRSVMRGILELTNPTALETPAVGTEGKAACKEDKCRTCERLMDPKTFMENIELCQEETTDGIPEAPVRNECMRKKLEMQLDAVNTTSDAKAKLLNTFDTICHNNFLSRFTPVCMIARCSQMVIDDQLYQGNITPESSLPHQRSCCDLISGF